MRLGVRARAVAVSALATAAFAFTAGTAAAHFTEAFHGSDRAWVDSTHDHLDVSDNECDGNSVYAEGYDDLGFLRVFDPNGCNSGYGHGDGLNFYQYRVCEQNVGCSAWRGT